MQFVYIPEGTYMMGSPPKDLEQSDDETWHRVILTRGFSIQTTEVTQGQWTALMGTRPWAGKSYVREGDDFPAVYISWHACQSFIEKLNSREGKNTYRLPTEAEWEYACRAGTKTRYCFGDNDLQLDDYAWYDGNADMAGQEYAHRVGTKKPNPWGLSDMHGNVWEWCLDACRWDGRVITDTYRNAVKDPLNRQGPRRIMRGGCWFSYARGCRSAVRGSDEPDDRGSAVGFRLIRMR
jgi:formylglycine-generating enzyme required for sulfatase activity